MKLISDKWHALTTPLSQGRAEGGCDHLLFMPMGAWRGMRCRSFPSGHCCTKNPARATWDGQAPSTHIQSKTETALKNLHVKWKAGNSYSIYPWCKVLETENSCETPTRRPADMAVVCQVAHRLAEHGHISAMSPWVGQSLRTDLPHLCFKIGTLKCLWHLGDDSPRGKIIN